MSRPNGMRAQMQIAAAILLAIATATTVVAVNSTLNYTGEEPLTSVIKDLFSKTVEVFARTSLSAEALTEKIQVWLWMDNGTAVPNAPLQISLQNDTLQEVEVSTGSGGFVSLPLAPGNYTVNASFGGMDYLLPSSAVFDVVILPEENTTVNETLELPVNETFELPLNETPEIAEEPLSTADLEVSVSVPERPTRGQAFDLTISVTNNGAGTAVNISIEVELPAGFSYETPQSCPDLSASGNHVSTVSVSSDSFSEPGPLTGKIIVRYEEGSA